MWELSASDSQCTLGKSVRNSSKNKLLVVALMVVLVVVVLSSLGMVLLLVVVSPLPSRSPSAAT